MWRLNKIYNIKKEWIKIQNIKNSKNNKNRKSLQNKQRKLGINKKFNNSMSKQTF